MPSQRLAGSFLSQQVVSCSALLSAEPPVIFTVFCFADSLLAPKSHHALIGNDPASPKTTGPCFLSRGLSLLPLWKEAKKLYEKCGAVTTAAMQAHSPPSQVQNNHPFCFFYSL